MISKTRLEERSTLPHPNERVTIGKAAKLCRLDYEQLAGAVAAGEIKSVQELRRVTLVRFGEVIDWFNRTSQDGGR